MKTYERNLYNIHKTKKIRINIIDTFEWMV